MSSYASVAAANAPPPEDQASPSSFSLSTFSQNKKQPRPDPALLNTTPPSASGNIDETANKVNVVPPDFSPKPATRRAHDDDDDDDGLHPPRKRRANRRLQEVEAEGLYLWEVTKHYLFRPGIAGGFIGLVNLGLLAGAGRAFYTQPHLRRDRNVLSSTAAATIALLSVEGYAAEKYRQTPRGRDEKRRAKNEGTLIYKHLREHILRPGVLGGIVGLLNTAVLGGVGYLSYIHWDRPTWDRRVVSAISVGLLALWGGEGYVAAK